MQDSNRKLAAAIIIAFTIVQFLIIMVFGYTPYPDSNGYIGIAQDCVAHGEPYPVASELPTMSFVWNVGSINIVALFLWLFGTVTPLFYFYALLKGLSAYFVYRISGRLFNGKVALAALLIYVLYPANYGEATSVLSELPFIFCMLAGIWLAMNNKVVAAGVVIGLGNWMRPMGIVFIATLIVYFIVIRKKKDILKIIAGYALFIVVVGTASYVRTGYFIYQAKTGWMALLQYSVDNSPDDDEYYTKADGFNAVQKDSVWQKRMVEWTADGHADDYVKSMPGKLVNTFVSDNVNLCVFLPDKADSEYMYEPLSMGTLAHTFPHFSWVQWLTVYNLLYFYLLFVMFVIGSIQLVRNRKYDAFALLFGVVFFGTAVLLLVGHGEARFHIPFMPFIIITAAYSLSIIYKRIYLHREALKNGRQ